MNIITNTADAITTAHAILDNYSTLLKKALHAAAVASCPWNPRCSLLQLAVQDHCGPESRGSRFNGSLDACMAALHSWAKWPLVRLSEGSREGTWCLTLRNPHEESVGSLGADYLLNGREDTKYRVEALGPHPVLTPDSGDAARPESDLVTVILEIDGEEAAEDRKAFGIPEGVPVLATCHPGTPLPSSEPRGCAVGDILTKQEALSKGWKVVKY